MQIREFLHYHDASFSAACQSWSVHSRCSRCILENGANTTRSFSATQTKLAYHRVKCAWPGLAFADPAFHLGLFVVELVVGVVSPASGRCYHCSGLASGVVAGVFCKAEKQTGENSQFKVADWQPEARAQLGYIYHPESKPWSLSSSWTE